MEGIIPSMPQADATYVHQFGVGELAQKYHTGIRVVAFVTRHGEDILERPVLNAAEAELAVSAVGSTAPSAWMLGAVHPQPAVASARALLTLPRQESVRVAVYDLLGRERLLLRDGTLDPGVHTLAFSTTGLENGLYFLRVTSGAQVHATSLIVRH